MADGNGLTPAAPEAVETVINQLAAQFGDRLTTNRNVREVHGRDESYHTQAPPDAVVFPQTTEEVVSIVKLCAEHAVPIIPFGIGSSLEGHVAALAGGVCIDLSQMNQILEVRPDDMDVTVEAGVTREQLNTYLRDTGLFFSVDPGANATLGGMAATGASGTTTVRYGTMRDVVLGMTVVMANGDVVRTRNRARKSSAGYDLTHLMIGSEGTLGIITELTVRLYGIPEAELTAVCPFKTLRGAVETVIQTIQLGVPVARIEFLDGQAAKGLAQHANLDLPAGPTLFLDFHGSEAALSEAKEAFQSIASEHGMLDFQAASSPEARKAIWDARHGALFAALALDPGKKPVITDACVPISKLADCIEETRADIDASPFIAPIVGHVGDGNFHTILMADLDDPEQVRLAKDINDRLVKRAVDMGGTCTGEHGVGSGKISFVEYELGTAVPVMRTIKQALDPQNILNPGKIVRL